MIFKARTSALAAISALLDAAGTGVLATEFDYRSGVRSLLEIRSEGLLLQAWDISCGAAALATVLKYKFGENVSERLVAEGMISGRDPASISRQGGFSFQDLRRFAVSAGYTAEGFKLSGVEALRSYSFAITPILEFDRQPHFVVVRTYNSRGILDIADPAFGNRLVPESDFAKAWSGNYALILGKKR